jgi:hypothetical protein
MLWKLLGLQKKLDALFDDGWVGLGFASHRANAPHALAGGAATEPGHA